MFQNKVQIFNRVNSITKLSLWSIAELVEFYDIELSSWRSEWRILNWNKFVLSFRVMGFDETVVVILWSDQVENVSNQKLGNGIIAAKRTICVHVEF